MSKDPLKNPKGSIRIPPEGETKVLDRQKSKCYKCEVHFPPPNPVGYYLRQIKQKTSGHGWHKHKQLEDYANVAAYCHSCLVGEAVKMHALRIKKAKYEKYRDWMEDKPRYAKKTGEPNFSKMIRDALEFMTGQEYFQEEINDLHFRIEEFENQAESFLEILTLYNNREDDLSFANELVNFFEYYTPPIRCLQTNEDIDNYSTDEKHRELLKNARDEEMKLIIDKKEAGYRHYQTNSDEYQE